MSEASFSSRCSRSFTGSGCFAVISPQTEPLRLDEEVTIRLGLEPPEPSLQEASDAYFHLLALLIGRGFEEIQLRRLVRLVHESPIIAALGMDYSRFGFDGPEVVTVVKLADVEYFLSRFGEGIAGISKRIHKGHEDIVLEVQMKKLALPAPAKARKLFGAIRHRNSIAESLDQVKELSQFLKGYFDQAQDDDKAPQPGAGTIGHFGPGVVPKIGDSFQVKLLKIWGEHGRVLVSLDDAGAPAKLKTLQKTIAGAYENAISCSVPQPHEVKPGQIYMAHLTTQDEDLRAGAFKRVEIKKVNYKTVIVQCLDYVDEPKEFKFTDLAELIKGKSGLWVQRFVFEAVLKTSLKKFTVSPLFFKHFMEGEIRELVFRGFGEPGHIPILSYEKYFSEEGAELQTIAFNLS